MKKVFTKVAIYALMLLGSNLVNAQYTVIWPTSDTNTVRMSQFADSSSIFALYPNRTPPVGYKGWLTKGLQSADPAKKDSAIWTWTGTGQANVGSAYSAFGTALNDEFGEVEETGILITIDDIFQSKKDRHITSFERDRHYGKRRQAE